MYVKYKYSIRQEIIAKFCNALANPARIRICQFLGKYQAAYFGRIHDEIPLSKATVSQHLSVLKEAGLIDAIVEAPHVKYSINRDNWMLATDIIDHFMRTCQFDGRGEPHPEIDFDHNVCCCLNEEDSEKISAAELEEAEKEAAGEAAESSEE